MAQYARTPDLLQQVAQLRARLEVLERRSPPVRDEVPFFPTSSRTMAYDDRTTFINAWETTIAPRGSLLSIGLSFLGDNVGGVATAGEWQVVAAGVVVGAGTVPASNVISMPAVTIDLAPYQSAQSLLVLLQTRRTSGATTGGRYGAGGSIGSSIRYARLS
ncbi:hypothetical protein AB0F42_24500 [Streptomyces buecherae]|uniref:hypothetical protein n=1 Tax=Streptomyces buecherae TaxID=2763006 RepID=UPI0033BFDA49